MGKSNSQRIKVGVFVVVGTILLIAALYYIGKQQHLFSSTIDLYADFENANGLQVGNNVRYSGINVGTVSDIEMKKAGQIIIRMSVEEKLAYFMKTSDVASISSDGLVGSMVVNVSPGEDQLAPKVVTGDTIQSHTKLGMDDMLTTLDTTNKNAALLSADLLKITHEILQGKGSMGLLLNDTIFANDILQTVVELRNTTKGSAVAIAKVNAIISKINYDESAAAVLLSDTASANQMRKVVTNFETSSNDINKITKNLDGYIKEIRTGKGAINHVTQDENFVKELDATMIQIKEASEKLNQNMEALQHNFLFRGYFRKLERKKEKEVKANNEAVEK